ncbi:DUF3152 domain-containing protein [Streptomyces sp. NPDC051018]|uniref:DUF3152 domain-containing protein n=1 Tax=Streptomyces sp. NPDC051018 TaxID=3365639 RepID=UPI0037ADB827
MALLCAAAVCWGALGLLPDSTGESVATGRDPGATSEPLTIGGPETAEHQAPRAPRPAQDPDGENSAAPETSYRHTYREDGPGTYTWARGTGTRAGTGGRLIRYGVKLEDGTGLDVDDLAAEIDGILRHPRGWTRGGTASFQRVSSPPYDMLVQVVSPGTTDRLCGAWGLDTQGQVNCAKAPDLVVNVRRWVDLSEQYRGRAADYHALIINHEAGHILGHGHRGCPGPGRPAPAMMQQIKGLKGCTANPWVYDDDGRLIDGPPVP